MTKRSHRKGSGARGVGTRTRAPRASSPGSAALSAAEEFDAQGHRVGQRDAAYVAGVSRVVDSRPSRAGGVDVTFTSPEAGALIAIAPLITGWTRALERLDLTLDGDELWDMSIELRRLGHATSELSVPPGRVQLIREGLRDACFALARAASLKRDQSPAYRVELAKAVAAFDGVSRAAKAA